VAVTGGRAETIASIGNTLAFAVVGKGFARIASRTEVAVGAGHGAKLAIGIRAAKGICAARGSGATFFAKLRSWGHRFGATEAALTLLAGATLAVVLAGDRGTGSLRRGTVTNPLNLLAKITYRTTTFAITRLEAAVSFIAVDTGSSATIGGRGAGFAQLGGGGRCFLLALPASTTITGATVGIVLTGAPVLVEQGLNPGEVRINAEGDTRTVTGWLAADVVALDIGVHADQPGRPAEVVESRSARVAATDACAAGHGLNAIRGDPRDRYFGAVFPPWRDPRGLGADQAVAQK